MHELRDEELMLAYQQGDHKAFEELYRRHSGRVYGFLRNHLRDAALADDVFQASFMKLHSARAKYDPSFPFVPWLFTVCKSVMIDAVRKKARTPEDLDAEAVESAASTSPGVDADGTDSRRRELPALGKLPARHRQALELRYGQELSFEQIAERLGTSPMNVRQLVSRAIRKLRRDGGKGDK